MLYCSCFKVLFVNLLHRTCRYISAPLHVVHIHTINSCSYVTHSYDLVFEQYLKKNILAQSKHDYHLSNVISIYFRFKKLTYYTN